MNYVERLIHRALAVPRRSSTSLFDPFDQVASWPLIAPINLAPQQSKTAATAEPGQPENKLQARAEPLQAQPPVTGNPVAQNMEASALMESDAAQRNEPGKGAQSATGTPQVALLAKADAFIRGLNVRPLPLRPEPSPDQPRLKTREAGTADPVPIDGQNTQSSGRMQLVRPVQPPPPPPPRPTAQSAASEPGRSVPAAEKPRPGRPSAATPPPAIVTSTVLVAPATPNRLDDLAHCSAISRFGIGQG